MALKKTALARSVARDPEASRRLALGLLAVKKEVPSHVAAVLASQADFVNLARTIMQHLDQPDGRKTAQGGSQGRQG
jgi:hypothetical protein